MKSLTDYIKESHETAVEKGWWDTAEGEGRSIGDQFTNFHAEISEAWEEYRNGHHYTEIYTNPDKPDKPEGISIELADLLIRVFDTCGQYNIPLETALQIKMEYNKTRPYRHGGKKA